MCVCVRAHTHTCVFIYYEGLAHIILGAIMSKICRAGWQLVMQASVRVAILLLSSGGIPSFLGNFSFAS